MQKLLLYTNLARLPGVPEGGQALRASCSLAHSPVDLPPGSKPQDPRAGDAQRKAELLTGEEPAAGDSDPSAVMAQKGHGWSGYSAWG